MLQRTLPVAALSVAVLLCVAEAPVRLAAALVVLVGAITLVTLETPVRFWYTPFNRIRQVERKYAMPTFADIRSYCRPIGTRFFRRSGYVFLLTIGFVIGGGLSWYNALLMGLALVLVLLTPICYVANVAVWTLLFRADPLHAPPLEQFALPGLNMSPAALREAERIIRRVQQAYTPKPPKPPSPVWHILIQALRWLSRWIGLPFVGLVALGGVLLGNYFGALSLMCAVLLFHELYLNPFWMDDAPHPQPHRRPAARLVQSAVQTLSALRLPTLPALSLPTLPAPSLPKISLVGKHLALLTFSLCILPFAGFVITAYATFASLVAQGIVLFHAQRCTLEAEADRRVAEAQQRVTPASVAVAAVAYERAIHARLQKEALEHGSGSESPDRESAPDLE